MTELTLKDSGLRWLWLAALVFILDISVKYLVMNYMGYGPVHKVEVLPFFNLLYIHNPGAAFSFLSQQSGWQRWLFIGIAFVVMLVLLVWMRKQPASEKWSNSAYAMIIGGAAGNNVFDRLVHGVVVDYLDFYWGSYHWPAFNLADSAIFVGAVMLVWDGFRKK